jgi:hypothetical protein
MRNILMASAVFSLLAIGQAGAEDMPWCVELDVFTRNCAFASRDECVAVAGNANGPATGASRCIRNPNYQPPATPARGKTSFKPHG